MEEKQIEILFTETNEPRRSVIKNDVLLWLLVTLGAILLVFAGSFCSVVLGMPIGVTQVGTYLILLCIIIVLYRVRLVSYRYALTERMFSVTRIVGRKDRPDANVHLTDITRIRDAAELARGAAGKESRLFHGKREQALAVTYRAAGQERTLLVGLTETMRRKLIEQWKTAKRS